MENLYEILQVSKNASKEVIEKSYKTLAKKYHPDIAKNKEKAEEIMKKINNAYDILSDDEKRKEYDEKLDERDNSNYSNQQKNDHDNVNYNNMQNNYYNPKTNYTYQTNNMYDRYNYDSYYDYINNPDLFNRFFRLNSTSRKILIIGIIVMFILLIKLLFDIYRFFKIEIVDEVTINKPITQTSSVSGKNEIEEKFVDDQELAYVFTDFMDNIKLFNIEKLNTYIAKDYKITADELYNIELNQNIIQNITDNMKIEISNSQSSNFNNGKIDIEVTRVDLDLVLLQVSKEIFFNYNINYTNERINNMIINSITENKENTVNKRLTLNFIQENSQWKIVIKNSDFYDIFGFNIKQQF